ncbi:MAG: DNA-directed DNA polymerase I [Thaumarchaeota archaeon]|nr:DNA-directed DNA polymerase I [Nitrososphaerota archaeon]
MEQKAQSDSVENLSDSILISATYDGDKKKAVLKFYEPKEKKIYLWEDNTNHRPYCLIRRDKVSLETLRELRARKDVADIVDIEKLDLRGDRKIMVAKVITTNPLAIGGGVDSIRSITTTWESDIKYYENFLYDYEKGLIPGAFYRIQNSKIVPVEYDIPANVREALKKGLSRVDGDSASKIIEWAQLLGQPLPDIKRVALDIEVVPPEENRLPDPETADHRVIAISFVSSDGLKEVLLLRRKDIKDGQNVLGPEVNIRWFDDEQELLNAIFARINEYPFVITFNGDEFDLKYLCNRAKKLGIYEEQVPIQLGRDWAGLRRGVHIDLYKTFINRSLQIYAFGNKYSEHTLNGVAEALLGKTKIELDDFIGNLPHYELANYCYNDAQITFDLTNFSQEILMKILLVIARVAKMPLDDASRVGVSNWIRSMLSFDHRRMNALIPRKDELQEVGGASTEAIIKGKKYKGGMVVEPKSGVHFNVAVLDFASLYPSIIKVNNLSYETVRCVHEECKSNKIEGTEYWVCTKRRGITSLLIGSLRDLRVNYYKPIAKSPNLTKEQKDLYNVVSQALKVILNASYGVMGAEIFPLYCLPVADATAALGRNTITATINRCKELDIEVVYGDTDSLFLKAPSQEQIKEITNWASDKLGIELDLDKVYRYVAFSSRKKNYLGVMPDGIIDIKGLTGKKSHVPRFIKDAFYETVEILSKVQSTEDFEKAREDIRNDIRKRARALKAKEVPLDQLAFTIMMSKEIEDYKGTKPQHVRAAEQLKIKKGKEVKAGEVISFIKTLGSNGVRPLELAKKEEVDTEKYMEYLRSTFDQLLDALGYDFEEILGARTLDEIFWGGQS